MNNGKKIRNAVPLIVSSSSEAINRNHKTKVKVFLSLTKWTIRTTKCPSLALFSTSPRMSYTMLICPCVSGPSGKGLDSQPRWIHLVAPEFFLIFYQISDIPEAIGHSKWAFLRLHWTSCSGGSTNESKNLWDESIGLSIWW